MKTTAGGLLVVITPKKSEEKNGGSRTEEASGGEIKYPKLPDSVVALHNEVGPDGASNYTYGGDQWLDNLVAVWHRILDELDPLKKLQEKVLAEAEKTLREGYELLFGPINLLGDSDAQKEMATLIAQIGQPALSEQQLAKSLGVILKDSPEFKQMETLLKELKGKGFDPDALVKLLGIKIESKEELGQLEPQLKRFKENESNQERLTKLIAAIKSGAGIVSCYGRLGRHVGFAEGKLYLKYFLPRWATWVTREGQFVYVNPETRKESTEPGDGFVPKRSGVYVSYVLDQRDPRNPKRVVGLTPVLQIVCPQHADHVRRKFHLSRLTPEEALQRLQQSLNFRSGRLESGQKRAQMIEEDDASAFGGFKLRDRVKLQRDDRRKGNRR